MRAALLLALAACATEPSSTELRAAAAPRPTARLDWADQFRAFKPGVYSYARQRGTTSGTTGMAEFGVAPNLSAPTHLDSTHDDTPDLKRRVRVTLQDQIAPIGSPSGRVTVHGRVWTRSTDPQHPGPTSVETSAPLDFVTNGTKITEAYFDEVTSVSVPAPGLGAAVTLTVEWWSGHEQEIDAGVGIVGPTTEADCETGWKVRFNGQDAPALWDATGQHCGAALMAGFGVIDGAPVVNDAVRGVYFPVDPDRDARDTFHHYRGGDFAEAARTWENWAQSVGAPRPWFDVKDHDGKDTRSRPLVVQLVRLNDAGDADNEVIDAARVLMTLEQDANGNPSLVAMPPERENPGAIAQLSSTGLTRLDPVHQATLPYPIVPAGTQPRLSQSAIDVFQHTSDPVSVQLDKLPTDGLDYWTEPGPGPRQFAGYLAYDDIVAATNGLYAAYQIAYAACTDATCQNRTDFTFCVHHAAKPSDFTIKIDRVHTYYDPARPDDALVIGDIAHLDLVFGVDQVLSNFRLEDIQGWLEATIPLIDIRLAYTAGPLLCLKKPAARELLDFNTNHLDRDHWLTCKNLSFAAGSGTLGAPIPFDLRSAGEQLNTPFHGTADATVHLAGIATDPGDGICDQAWLSDTITEELEKWQTDTELTIGHELVTSPGEDEALNRLLSPYELGVPRIDNVPADTPPYSVHPLATYELSAKIAKTAAETDRLGATEEHGMYVPYITRAIPQPDMVPYATWYCAVLAGQFCDGLAGTHEAKLEDGLDPAGAAYDVAINYTTAHLSQALWAQAPRPDRLGSPTAPVEMAITEHAVADRAAELGYTDVTAALTAAGSRFAVVYHQEGAPYAYNPDVSPAKLLYAAQNVVLELVVYRDDGTEGVVAKILVDVIDYDHKLALQRGGVAPVSAAWGNRSIFALTTTYLPGCYDLVGAAETCNQHLVNTLTSLWTAPATEALLDMMRQQPALQLFDSGQESAVIRHLKNPRTYLLGEGVALVGDLCAPGSAGCP